MKKINLIFTFLFLTFLTLVSADVISVNSGGGNNLIVTPSQELEGFFFDTTRIPFNPTPILFSVDGTNESDADLNCTSLISDPDDDFLTVVVRWYEGGSFSSSSNYSVDNGTVLNANLDNSNLDLGEVWKCSMQVYDNYKNSEEVDSNNLTIIDQTNPLVYIESPNSSEQYLTLNIDFNVSIIENENVSICLYSLDNEANVSMDELNDSYFWSQPSLGPGEHNVTYYCNDTSNNWGTNFTNFTILNEAAIAVSLSPALAWNVNWSILSLPAEDLDAVGNNLDGATSYYVNISAENTNVDLYVRADGDLLTAALDVIGLGNETFVANSTNSSVPDLNRLTMSTNYTLIGENLGDLSVVYMKFYLDAPTSQAAGNYLNALDFKAVRYGQAPE